MHTKRRVEYMKKTLVCLLLALALLVSVLPALAVEGNPGDTVTVNVTAKSTSAAFAVLNFSYDKTALTFVSATNSYGSYSDGKFFCASIKEVINGVIGSITFKINDSAKAGT